MNQSKPQEPKKKKKEKERSSSTSHKKHSSPSTITRVSHVPMQSVKMIKMGPAVLGSTVFATSDYSVNAGNSDLWPRLAQVARTYQYWKAVNWHVRYEPIASMFGANKSGIVTVSLLQNWYDAPPDTMTAQTERARKSVTVPAWESVTLKLDPTRWKYVRDSAGSQGQDMRLDDEIIEVGVEGTDASAVGAAIGYLYLTADIEFRIPYTVSMLNAPRTNGVFVLNRTTDLNFVSSPGGTSTAVDVSPASDGFLLNSAYTGATTSGGVLYLTGGTYRVRVQMNFICAASPSYVLLSWSSTGHKQLIQLEGATSTLGAHLALSDIYARSVSNECVVTVAEGAVASMNPVVKATQASSTSITGLGMILIVSPH